jgi:hypothetical protein
MTENDAGVDPNVKSNGDEVTSRMAQNHDELVERYAVTPEVNRIKKLKEAMSPAVAISHASDVVEAAFRQAIRSTLINDGHYDHQDFRMSSIPVIYLNFPENQI